MHSAHKRKNGIFYTPALMARLLASRAIDNQDFLILDPACGDGILLKAAAERYAESHITPRPRLVGCDRFRPKRLSASLEFVRSDFFEYESIDKFDVILTNPPYVQSSKIDRTARERYYRKYAKELGLSHNLDLWAYFLVKCVKHLKEGGSIAAVLPWSFLEAEYAQEVRKWLAKSFGEIEVLVLEGAHFEETVKRVLLVWLHEFGSAAPRVQLASAQQCTDTPDFHSISMDMWISANVMTCLNSGAEDIHRRLEQADFKALGEYADIAIGVVTGANRYFIQSEQEAAKLGFPRGSGLPILTSVEDLDSVAGSKSPDKVLIQFGRMTRKRKRYVAKGRRLHLNQRVHCQRRQDQTGSWYKVAPGATPDAFFTYRVARLPYLILNPDGYQCTNTLHKISFKNTSKIKRKWIQLSLLSVFGQLFLEAGARHYGNGILKIEPHLLKKALVYTSRTKIPHESYKRILQRISEGDKETACADATRLVAGDAKLDETLIASAIAVLNRIRDRRGAVRLRLGIESYLPRGELKASGAFSE
jgi:adenine-specific DNA-methyltransferase